jgi:hypothetical protein
LPNGVGRRPRRAHRMPSPRSVRSRAVSSRSRRVEEAMKSIMRESSSSLKSALRSAAACNRGATCCSSFSGSNRTMTRRRSCGSSARRAPPARTSRSTTPVMAPVVKPVRPAGRPDVIGPASRRAVLPVSLDHLTSAYDGSPHERIRPSRPDSSPRSDSCAAGGPPGQENQRPPRARASGRGGQPRPMIISTSPCSVPRP